MACRRGGAQERLAADGSGDTDPYGIQYLLNRARWLVAETWTALCGYVQAHLGDPQAVGIIDETAFLKKGGAFGRHVAGLGRGRYSLRLLWETAVLAG